MASSRNRVPVSGRSAIDWEEAFAHYASLPPRERSYDAVAKAFGVSQRTVERHGREEGWRKRLRSIGERIAVETDSALVEERKAHREKVKKLLEATFIGYAEKLRQGEVRMSPADLDRLHRLFQQLADDPQPVEHGSSQVFAHSRSDEHVQDVLDALADCGALDALGLERRPVHSEEASEA
jgi:hypothetical protein